MIKEAIIIIVMCFISHVILNFLTFKKSAIKPFTSHVYISILNLLNQKCTLNIQE